MSEVKFPSKKQSNHKDETIEEIVGQDAPPIEPKENTNIRGVVTDCLLLNVRLSPSTNGVVGFTIPKGTKVIISQVGSTDDFYNITTKDGMSGFCVKKFIKIY
jgi:uncharacterized protein YgiM (DUF1202 family)